MIASETGLVLKGDIIEAGSDEDPLVLTFPATGPPIRLRTPDAHAAQMWIARSAETWVVSTSEAHLLASIADLSSRSIDSCVDLAAVGVRWELGQSLLMTSVVRGAVCLPAAVEAFLDSRSADDVARTCRQLLRPVNCNAEEFLELILSRYAQAIAGCETLTVLASPGWDSRMEIAALNRVRREGQYLHFLHLFTSEPELRVVRALARACDASLTVLDPVALLPLGMSWTTLRSRLRLMATWRPTLPIFAAMTASALQSSSGPVFGFASFNLKGNENVSLSPEAPTEGRIRRRSPSQEFHEFYHDDSTAADYQEKRWVDLLRLSADWEWPARRDYIVWQAHHALTYAHRLRVLSGLISPAPWHSRELVELYLGLPSESKAGVQFIEWALGKLSPGLGMIPVVSSTGSGNRLTQSSAQDFARNGDQPIVLEAEGPRAMTTLPLAQGRDRAPSIYSDYFSRILPLCESSAKTDVGRHLTRPSRVLTDDRAVTAFQLTEFLDAAVDLSRGRLR